MTTPAARREERRKNLIALAIGFGIVALLGLFAWRPAPLLGVSEHALASSVGGEVNIVLGFGAGPNPRCTEEAEDQWVCAVTNPSASESSKSTYRVELTGAGCWRAARIDEPGQLRGCISIFDY
jgi:hypothetical protein